MKIGFTITARLKSSRLPLKLLMDLGGKTVVEQVIERAKSVAFVDSIVLCTSDNPQDFPLAAIARNNGIYYYLGNEQDVLKRLTDAARFFGFDCFLNITGENPLFSVEYANRVADVLRLGKHDFVYVTGLPIGCAVYGLSAKALEVVCQIKEEVDTEIWGLLINQPDIFSVHKIEASPEYCIEPDTRITMDYLEDYRFINTIFKAFPNDAPPPFLDVINYLSSNPDVLKINSMHKQAGLDASTVDRINTFYREHASEILKLLNK